MDASKENDSILYLVALKPEPGYEEQFNRWYEEEHIPELLECPGFNSARRYRAVEGDPQYIAIYEIESMDAFKSTEYQRLAARELDDLTPLAREVVSHRQREILAKYRLISEHEK